LIISTGLTGKKAIFNLEEKEKIKKLNN